MSHSLPELNPQSHKNNLSVSIFVPIRY